MPYFTFLQTGLYSAQRGNIGKALRRYERKREKERERGPWRVENRRDRKRNE